MSSAKWRPFCLGLNVLTRFTAVRVVRSTHITPSISVQNAVIINSECRRTDCTCHNWSYIFVCNVNTLDVGFLWAGYKFIFVYDSVWWWQHQNQKAPFQRHLLQNLLQGTYDTKCYWILLKQRQRYCAACQIRQNCICNPMRSWNESSIGKVRFNWNDVWNVYCAMW